MTLPPVVAPGDVGSAASDSGAGPGLTRALEALSDVLREAHEGRPITSAGLKVTLQKRLGNPKFDDALGFRTFRAFLDFAQAQGLIATRPTTSDVYVYLASRAPVEPLPSTSTEGESPRSSRSDRLRSDIWSAFMDFQPGLVRLYDRRARHAWKLPATASAPESDAETTVRRRMEQQPDDFVQIPNVTRDEQLGWMREFAETAGTHRERLEDALGLDRPLAAFASVTRTQNELRDAWRAFLVHKVKQKVLTWAAEHGIQDDFTEDVQVRPRGSHRSNSLRVTATGQEQESLRQQILEVLARLPLEDLMRLPVPVGSFFRP